MKYIKNDNLPIDIFLEIGEIEKEVDFWQGKQVILNLEVKDE